MKKIVLWKYIVEKILRIYFKKNICDRTWRILRKFMEKFFFELEISSNSREKNKWYFWLRIFSFFMAIKLIHLMLWRKKHSEKYLRNNLENFLKEKPLSSIK